MSSTLLPALSTSSRVAASLLSRTRQYLPGLTFARNAYVFERLHPLKKSSDPHPNVRRQDLLLRHLPEDLAMTYKVVEEKQNPEPVKVILLKNTDDYGRRGQVVTVDDPRLARDELLLPGLAVYASPENLEKYKDITISEDNWRFSSQTIKEMLPYFSRLVVPVTMNLHHDWQLEAWHLRVCFHRLGYNVEEECIQMPDEPIKGPDLDLQDKEFYIYVTINNFERFPVRCVINHWSDDPDENARLRKVGWQHRFHEPVFEKDREFLARMKRIQYGKLSSAREDNQMDLNRFKEWKKDRDDRLQEEMTMKSVGLERIARSAPATTTAPEDQAENKP